MCDSRPNPATASLSIATRAASKRSCCVSRWTTPTRAAGSSPRPRDIVADKAVLKSRFVTPSPATLGVRHKLAAPLDVFDLPGQRAPLGLYQEKFFLSSLMRSQNRARMTSLDASKAHSDAVFCLCHGGRETLQGSGRDAGLIFEADQGRRTTCASVSLSVKIKVFFGYAMIESSARVSTP